MPECVPDGKRNDLQTAIKGTKISDKETHYPRWAGRLTWTVAMPGPLEHREVGYPTYFSNPFHTTVTANNAIEMALIQNPIS